MVLSEGIRTWHVHASPGVEARVETEGSPVERDDEAAPGDRNGGNTDGEEQASALEGTEEKGKPAYPLTEDEFRDFEKYLSLL